MLLNHFLDLLLLGVAVAGEGFFDLVRSVFVDHETILAGDEEDDAAGLGDRDAGGDVLGEKEFLDAEAVGVVHVDDFVEGVVNVEETVWEGGVRGGRDDTAVDHLWATAIHGINWPGTSGWFFRNNINNTKTTNACTWIYA